MHTHNHTQNEGKNLHRMINRLGIRQRKFAKNSGKFSGIFAIIFYDQWLFKNPWKKFIKMYMLALAVLGHFVQVRRIQFSWNPYLFLITWKFPIILSWRHNDVICNWSVLSFWAFFTNLVPIQNLIKDYWNYDKITSFDVQITTLQLFNTVLWLFLVNFIGRMSIDLNPLLFFDRC